MKFFANIAMRLSTFASRGFSRAGLQMRCALVLVGLLWAPSALGQGQTLGAMFSGGNEAFFRGDFAAAIGHYEQLVDAGVRDPDVYFNLATAYARHHDLGHAILYFERASRLSSSDDDIVA